MKRGLVLLMLAVLPHIAGANPPSGWQILQDSKLASGGSAWDSVTSLKTTGTLRLGGMSGGFVSYQDLVRAKFRNDFAVGPITQSSGFDGKIGWTLDSNGNIAPHDSPSERRSDRTQAYLAARDYWFPRRWPASAVSAGTAVRGGVRYERVTVTPKGGVAFQMWIDATTRRISRIIVGGRFNKEVTSYSDYRDLHGLSLPFHISLGARPADHGQTIIVSQVVVNGAVAADLYQMPPQHLADYSFVSNARSATIPLQFIGNHIYFPVEINGHEFQFGLDTGGMNIISPAAATAIGVPSEGSAQATGVGAKRVAVSFAKIRAVGLASKLIIRNQLFVVVPLSGISAVEGTTLDGVLGYELFKRFIIRIDYATHRLQILQPTDFEARSAGTAVPFTYDGRMPQVAGSLDGLPGRFDIDTGSRDTLSINSPFVKAHRLLALYNPTARTVIGWGAGGAAYGRLARARKFRVGDLTVRCPVVELSTQADGTDAERSVAGVIGNGILGRFTVTFDYAKQLVYLRPNSNYGRPFGYDRAGMWVNRQDGGFVVESVLSGGPAQRAGLREGDLITSVDGQQTAKMQLADFRQLLVRSRVGTRVDLGVVRAGRMLPISIVLRNLIPRCSDTYR
jgi:hypothetical protein